MKTSPLKIQWFSEKFSVIPTRSGFASSVHTSVLASRIVLDRNNAEPLGTLFIQFNDRFIHDVLKNVKIGRTGSLLLLDPSSGIVYKQESELLLADGVGKSVILPLVPQGHWMRKTARLPARPI